jgi:hypothetical protein
MLTEARDHGKRRWLAVLFIGVWFSLYAIPQAEAAEYAAAVLTTGDIEAESESVTSIYRLEQVDQGIMVQDITVQFNEQAVGFKDVQSLYDGLQVAGYIEDPGQIRIIAVSDSNDHAVRQGGEMLSLQWDVKSIEGLSEEVILLGNVEWSYEQAAESGNANLPQASAAAEVPGDMNGDGELSRDDISLLLNGMDKTLEDEDWARYALGDVTQDGQITMEDVKQVAHWMLYGVSMKAEVSLPGDLNGDNQLSIGDLAILVKAYGLTKDHQGWDAVKQADYNNNDEIDLTDLVELAQLILQS